MRTDERTAANARRPASGSGSYVSHPGQKSSRNQQFPPGRALLLGAAARCLFTRAPPPTSQEQVAPACRMGSYGGPRFDRTQAELRAETRYLALATTQVLCFFAAGAPSPLSSTSSATSADPSPAPPSSGWGARPRESASKLNGSAMATSSGNLKERRRAEHQGCGWGGGESEWEASARVGNKCKNFVENMKRDRT